MHFTIPTIALFAAVGLGLPAAEPAPSDNVPAVNGTELVARDFPALNPGPGCFYAYCVSFQGVYTYHSYQQCAGPWGICFGCDTPGYYTYSCGGFQWIDDFGPVEGVPGLCPAAQQPCKPRS